MSRSSITTAALALLLAAGAGACTESKGKADKPAEARAVIVQTVVFEPRSPSRTLVGTVRPRIESDLGFRIGGKVAARLVQTGERVRAGQILAQLDAVDLGLQREQAEAEVTAARASLAQADAEDKRIATLRREGWSTASAFDRQRAAVEEARSRLSRAERTLSLSSNSLDYAALRADADGVITAALIEPGQVVAQGQTAFRLARLDSREAVVSVPEALIDRVRSARASVALWSEPGKTFNATLREMSPSADPATRTYQARFTIDNPPTDLEFGLTATVTVSDRENEQVARLPLSSLFNQGTGPSVYVVNPADGALTLKPVDVLGYEARDVLIRGGIAAGEQVVTLGVQKLDISQKVRIVAPTH
ncbi:MAG: efflux RND transporter periplasmic adaptor subunit [Hyphomicrobiales bacterium]|nr:efflux RND transporter periplasmic adaptor subunit [Hyphomicrobiales bacterium]